MRQERWWRMQWALNRPYTLGIILAALFTLTVAGVAVAQDNPPTGQQPTAATRPAATPKARWQIVLAAGALGDLGKIGPTDTHGVDYWGDGQKNGWLETVAYKSKGLPSGADLSASFYPTSRFGFGAAFSMSPSKSNVDVTARLEGWPTSKQFPGVQDTKPVNLKHAVEAIHFQIKGRIKINSRANVELFAGPSYYSGKLDTAKEVDVSFSGTSTYNSYLQQRQSCYYSGWTYVCEYWYEVVQYRTAFDPKTVSWGAKGITVSQERVSKLGITVGADVSYFFSGRFGVGCQFRYGVAKVKVPGLAEWEKGDTRTYDSKDTRTKIDVNLGGPQIVLGFRIKL